MKKGKLLSLFYAAALALFIPASAAQARINVTVNGESIPFDVAPQIINDRTMVPMRAIFEKLGAEVSWDDSTKTATAIKGSTTVSTTIGNQQINVNGTSKTIDTAPIIIDSRTLVPVRFVSESLGYNVEWNQNTQTVIITNGLEVHFIDVGQADSALILSGDKAMLIDGGNKADGELVLNYLRSKNVDYLDYVICTHGHEDHVGGLPYVIQNISTGIVYAQDNNDTQIFDSFINTVNSKNIPIKDPVAGEKISLGNSEIEILGPVGFNYSDYNDSSIVLRVDHLDNSFLFTGDAGYAAEADILSTGLNLQADVLKVGHHGSSTASSYSFLEAVNPYYAVISCGANNSYGHPHAETLSSLYSKNIVTYRTDERGNIIASSDGDTIFFSFDKIPYTASEVISTSPVVTPAQTGTVPQASTAQQQANSYIGNKNSKKLHLPTCGSLPKESNRVYFSSFSEAASQGYTACKNCNPS